MPEIFVSCGSGLEPFLNDEITEMGYKPSLGYRGVYVDIEDFSDVYKINYNSRIGSRVLYPLIKFKVQKKEDLYSQSLEFDWNAYLKPHQTFAIDFSVEHRAFQNSLFAAQVVKDAICDKIREKTGKRPSVDTYQPKVQFHLLIRNSQATLSLDTSLKPLHKRGYRTEAVEAPLNESLAAALLKITLFKDEIILDPCMGSGTFLIEAAMQKANLPPGYLRREWGFFSHPEFDPDQWALYKKERDQQITWPSKVQFYGCDINKNALRQALGNMHTAGLAKAIEIQEYDFRQFNPRVKPAIIIANPPYGKRMEEEDSLIPLYRSLGDFMKKLSPAKGFILTGSQLLSKEIGLRASKRHVIFHGGLEARFLEFDLY